MSARRLVYFALALILAACATPKEEKAKAAEQKERERVGRSQIADPSFQAFLGRLRIAVAQKDLPTLSSMMTVDFGYRWDEPPVGDNIFTYWDLSESWPILGRVLREDFHPHENYLVAVQTTAGGAEGYRAGMRQVNGSWKFAYFLPPEGQ